MNSRKKASTSYRRCPEAVLIVCILSSSACRQGNRVLTGEDFEKVVLGPTGVEAFALDADFEAGFVL